MLKGVSHCELRLTNHSTPVGAHGITEEGQQSDRSVSNPIRQHPIRHGQKYCYSKVSFAVFFFYKANRVTLSPNYGLTRNSLERFPPTVE